MLLLTLESQDFVQIICCWKNCAESRNRTEPQVNHNASTRLISAHSNQSGTYRSNFFLVGHSATLMMNPTLLAVVQLEKTDFDPGGSLRTLLLRSNPGYVQLRHTFPRVSSLRV
jgi:hypothetical protein